MQIETKTTTKARNGKNYEYTAFTFSNKKTDYKVILDKDGKWNVYRKNAGQLNPSFACYHTDDELAGKGKIWKNFMQLVRS